MKTIIALFAALFAVASFAETETVDGVQYTFSIADGKATLGTESSHAIDFYTSGEIIIPKKLGGCPVTAIGDCAFGYRGITSVTIPEGVTTIGNEAFDHCVNLTSVVIPSSVTAIGSEAFSCCSSLTSITIPESVMTIGERAFDNCRTLVSITIPEGVTTIGEGMFSYCSSLVSVTIPESVTVIGNDAFSSCSSLTSITIPESVTTIGDSAFSSCSSLTSITIPESVTMIGDGVFSGCSSLLKIEVAAENPSYCSIDGVLYAKDARTLIACPAAKTAVTMPEDVTTIGIGAFESCRLIESVTIPKGVTTIGERTFSGCSSLSSVTIPEGVMTIGERAFVDCRSLESVTVPSTVTTIGKWAFYNTPFDKNLPDGMVVFGRILYKFKGTCPSAVVIPEDITTIGVDAFENCSSLESVTIPEGVTTICNTAFYKCTSLKTVTIPKGVTTIGNGAFIYCYSLESVSIPKSVTTIGVSAFRGIDPLWLVRVEDGDQARVKELMREAVEDVDALIFAEVNPQKPDGGPYTEMNDGVEYTFSISNGEATIGTGSEVAAIPKETAGALVIPSKLCGCLVTAIGDYAFNSCSSLKSVMIPRSVRTIGDSAFRGVDSLETVSVEASDTVRVFEMLRDSGVDVFKLTFEEVGPRKPDGGPYAERICGVDYTYSISDGKSTISDVSVSVSGALVIPPTLGGCPVTTIGDSVFYYCGSLSSVIILKGMTTIGDGAFKYCSSLASVTMPESVTTIGQRAFYNCGSLESVTIPESVTAIGEKAFESCTSLKSVTIPGSLTTIGECAFEYCSSLESVTIREGVTTIGQRAFYNCGSLASVTIPESVTVIGGRVFSGCSSLRVVYVSKGDMSRVKELMRGQGVDVDTLEFVEMFDPVAKIGEKTYPTLQAAANAAENGDVVTLLSEVEITGLTVTGKAVILEHNGMITDIKPLKGTSIGPAINSECTVMLGDWANAVVIGDLKACVALTANDVDEDGNAILNKGAIYTKYRFGSGYITYFVGKSITLDSDMTLPVYNRTSGSIAFCGKNGEENALTLELNGYTLLQPLSDNGHGFTGFAAVAVNSGYLTIQDTSEEGTGKIIGCTNTLIAWDYSGTEEGLEPSHLTLKSGTISSLGGWTGTNRGSVVVVYSDFVMDGGTIVYETANENCSLMSMVYDALGNSCVINGGTIGIPGDDYERCNYALLGFCKTEVNGGNIGYTGFYRTPTLNGGTFFEGVFAACDLTVSSESNASIGYLQVMNSCKIVLNGGTYGRSKVTRFDASYEVMTPAELTDYLAAGYAVVINENGLYAPLPKTPDLEITISEDGQTITPSVTSEGTVVVVNQDTFEETAVIPQATGLYGLIVKNVAGKATGTGSLIGIVNAREKVADKKTIAVAVPFAGATVENLLNTKLLSEGDELKAYVNGAYRMWALTSAGWVGRQMVDETGIHEGLPASTPLARGAAAWVTTAGKIVAFGVYDGTECEPEVVKGYNLLGNPMMTAITPAAKTVGDVLIPVGTSARYTVVEKAGGAKVWQCSESVPVEIPGLGISGSEQKLSEKDPTIAVGGSCWLITK